MTKITTYPSQLVDAPKDGGTIEVRSPYSGEVVGAVEEAGEKTVDQAFAVAAGAGRKTMRAMPAYERSDILEKNRGAGRNKPR